MYAMYRQPEIVNPPAAQWQGNYINYQSSSQLPILNEVEANVVEDVLVMQNAEQRLTRSNNSELLANRPQ